jgi:hypothetical protein
LGEIQDFYTQNIFSDGFCVVSYYDMRDAIIAFSGLLEEDLAVQYCPNGYVTMVSSDAQK